jgi:hypothetical protein
MAYQGSGLPPRPPAGWYPDPQVPAQLRYWDGATWSAHTAPSAAPPPPPGPSFLNRVAPPPPGESDDATLVRRLALYERLSGWAWLTLGILQILTIAGIIAGAWNIYAAITRIKIAPRIERREATIPSAFEPLTGYVIIGVINLVLGGVIGLVFLALDLFIRDQVLKYRGLFGTGAAPTVGGAPWAPTQGGAPGAVYPDALGTTDTASA